MVRVVLAAAIFISYGLQFYVPAKEVFPSLARSCLRCFSERVADNILRVTFVLITCKSCQAVQHCYVYMDTEYM